MGVSLIGSQAATGEFGLRGHLEKRVSLCGEYTFAGVPLMRCVAPVDLKTTVIFSVSLEGPGNVEVVNEANVLGYDDTVTLKGSTPDLGDFTIDITTGPDSNSHPVHSHPSYVDKPLDKTIVSSYFISEEASLWQTKGTAD
jgi:hypothetical protein